MDRRGREGRRERKGGVSRGRIFAKISRPPAAAAFRNEERREREVAADDDDGGGGGGRERTMEGALRTEGRDRVARETKEGARRERSQKWRKKRNGECTQHRRVRKRAFREYRSSPLDGLTERRRRGSRGGGGLVGDGDGDGDGGRGWKRGAGGKGGRMVVRRRKEGFGRRPGSLGCLWSRHAACAVFSARLTMPACYPSATPNEG